MMILLRFNTTISITDTIPIIASPCINSTLKHWPLFYYFSGNTPLHIAAGRRLKEIVALLMAYGANPAIANGEGDFPSDLPASLLVGSHLYSL